MNEQWTEAAIRSRLGVSSAVFQRRRLGRREVESIRELGFRFLEISVIERCFDFRDRAQVAEVSDACHSCGLRLFSFHCADLPLASDDETERKRGVAELARLLDVALEVGAEVVTVHLKNNAAARKSIGDALKRIERTRLVLGVENVSGVNRAAARALVDEFASPQFKMLLDIGHARDADGLNPFTVKTRARSAVVECGDRLCGVHLHETLGQPRHRDHHAPFAPGGIIQWPEVLAGLADVGYEGALIFEDGRGENPEGWLRVTAAFPERFVAVSQTR